MWPSELIFPVPFEPHLNLNLNCKAEEFTKEKFFSGLSELLIFNSVEELWFLWISKDKVAFVLEISMLRLQIINFIRSPFLWVDISFCLHA